jgi:hypothetical protein
VEETPHPVGKVLNPAAVSQSHCKEPRTCDVSLPAISPAHPARIRSCAFCVTHLQHRFQSRRFKHPLILRMCLAQTVAHRTTTQMPAFRHDFVPRILQCGAYIYIGLGFSDHARGSGRGIVLVRTSLGPADAKTPHWGALLACSREETPR